MCADDFFFFFFKDFGAEFFNTL